LIALGCLTCFVIKPLNLRRVLGRLGDVRVDVDAPDQFADLVERRSRVETQLATRRHYLLDRRAELTLGVGSQLLECLHEAFGILGAPGDGPEELGPRKPQEVIRVYTEQSSCSAVDDSHRALTITKDDRFIDRVDDCEKPVTNR
jgi:hypothetical protein